MSVLIAWTLWLLFNLLIAKWHGPDGLRATPAIARAFRPHEWALLIPWRALADLLERVAPTVHTVRPGNAVGQAESLRLTGSTGLRDGETDGDAGE